jgi:threonine/homoserine/homoserine lactone efflux protein
MDFLPGWPVLLAFTIAVTVIAITPGPDMTLFLSKTLAHGRRAGLAAYLGASTGLLVHTLFAAVGLTALLAASATAFAVVKFAGAAYLLWLAISALRHGSALRIERGRGRGESFGRLFFAGLGINLLNPKIILFFVTFLPQFVTPDDPAAMGKLIFLGLCFVIWAFPICLGLIFAADRIAGMMRRSAKITRVIDYVFASVFAGFAVAILFEKGRG